MCILAGCSRPADNSVQGYAEGEFVYIASPFAGELKSLDVQRGDQVKTDKLLFTLDNEPEKSARDEAERRLVQAHSSLEDARKGRRPTEIESAEAQLRQAQAAGTFGKRTRADRKNSCGHRRLPSRTLTERVQRGTRTANGWPNWKPTWQQLIWGSRSDQIAAAEANVRALTATLARAGWDLSQKRQAAPEAGLIYDTLYREGEWVAAGHPVVVLLPPRNIKVRAFVPEARVSSIHYGETVRVIVDSVPAPFTGKVSFISPKAEYTPPVIYNRENRGKLVFMIEVEFDAETAARLHPGQPVDVQLGP